MRILVYPHAMELGGSQLNAVELAGAMSVRGHSVTVVSEPGPLVDEVRRRGLDHVSVPLHRRRPSISVMRVLRREAAQRDIDVVHAFEWPPAVEAWTAFAAAPRTVVAATVMSMSVAPFLPRDLPLTVGTRDILDSAHSTGFRRVRLLEPPIDVEANAPGFPVDSFRQLVPEEPGVPDVVVVSRLANELKLEGLLVAMDAIGARAANRPARLVIVGDGPARDRLTERAAQVNQRAGRPVIVLAGEMRDPRSAYSAATVCLGMGGSALRAMAAGKPLIVQGERGFWETLTPSAAAGFHRTGWYGIGDESEGAAVLRSQLEPLLDSPGLRAELGDYGRRLAVSEYSLAVAAESLERWFHELVDERLSAAVRIGGAIRSVPNAAALVSYKLRRRRQRRRGTATVDDFNAVARR